jgi:hypothetical protein
MDLAHNAVEAAPEPRRRVGWAADNRRVRAVGRVPRSTFRFTVPAHQESAA